jgi:hypothetical protein
LNYGGVVVGIYGAKCGHGLLVTAVFAVWIGGSASKLE